MALALQDRVKETTTVTGTGTATLLGATTGFQSFAVVGNANTTYYCIADQGGANWEVGIGTYTASGTTLARTTVLSSSNAGSLVAFTAGIKDVFVTYPSSKGLWKDASGNAIGLGTPASGVVTNLTGTASININGTVGATTATTGAFTTLAYTGTLTGSTGVVAIGTNQIYKDASGNVGIGTSSPQAKEHIAVNTSAITETLRLDNIFNTGDNGNKITWYNAAQTPEAANISGFRIGATTGFGLSFSTSSNFATTAAVERMRIDSSGNVGIGTTAPNAKLGIYSSTSTANLTQWFGGTSDPNFITIAKSGVTGAGAGTPQFSLGMDYSTTYVDLAAIKFARDAGAGGNMQFFTGVSANGTERMRIDSSGNVGIGTSIPATLLHLGQGQAVIRFGSTSNGFDIGRDNSSGTFIQNATQASPYNAFIWQQAGAERMRIDSSGNVGIGTTAPAANIRLSLIEGTNTAPYQLRLGHNNTGYSYDIGRSTSTGLLAFYGNQTSATGYTFGGVDGERMRIDSSGNVLVGATTFPSASSKMLVSGDLNATYTNGVIQGQSKTAGDVSYPALYLSKFDNNSTTSQVLVRFAIGNYAAGQGQINANGVNAAAFGSFSDSRLKENITDLPSQLNNILALRPVEFDFIESEGGGHQIGFIAQEVQEIYPDLVGERTDGMLTLSDMNKNDARLIKAIQEQQTLIEALTARLTKAGL
jgi:hypothetical protein